LKDFQADNLAPVPGSTQVEEEECGNSLSIISDGYSRALREASSIIPLLDLKLLITLVERRSKIYSQLHTNGPSFEDFRSMAEKFRFKIWQINSNV